MKVTANLNKNEGDFCIVVVKVEEGEDVVICCALVDVEEICDIGVFSVVVDGFVVVVDGIFVAVEVVDGEGVGVAVVNDVLQRFLYSVVVGSCEGVVIAGPL